jgi:glycosyltransferase involved in cell wall biosynthesis
VFLPGASDSMNAVSDTRLRVAVVTQDISHFEVPLFRLLASRPDIDLRVFYLRSPHDNRAFDESYQQGIDWGEDMLAGYPSQRCGDSRDALDSVRAWRADAAMVYGYAWPGALGFLLKCRTYGTPLVFRGTLNHYKDPRLSLGQRFRRPIRGLVFHLFDALQYGGAYSLRVLRRSLVPRRKLFFAPYGVDTPFFLAEARREEDEGAGRRLRSEWGWADAFPVILYIGQLSWFKGPDIALEVFLRYHAENPNSKLLVVGNGRMLDGLRKTAAERGLETAVRFQGYCPSKQTVNLYRAADVALFTSRYETWGRSVNEAMLCARPCIINRVLPAAGGLVRDGANGYVVSGKAVEDYCRALREYASSSGDKRSALGRAARSAAEAYSYENHLGSIVESLRYAALRRRSTTAKGGAA